VSRAAPTYQVRRPATGEILVDRLRPAHTHWTRFRGLLGTAALERGDGLWLKPCRQVHMIGMRYPIDVVFLDEDLRVVRTIAALRPGAISPRVVEATSVLELPVGSVAGLGISPGSRVAIDGDDRQQHARARGGMWARLRTLLS
jgi:uncharacterized membrane protein (UPF0127 family)